MANNVYKTLGANAQTLTLLATVCLEDPVAQEKAKTLLDKALTQRPDYIKAVVKKAELLSKSLFFTLGVLSINSLPQKRDRTLLPIGQDVGCPRFWEHMTALGALDTSGKRFCKRVGNGSCVLTNGT